MFFRSWVKKNEAVQSVVQWKENETPSIETHLAVVKELPINKFLPKCADEKSSTERRS